VSGGGSNLGETSSGLDNVVNAQRTPGNLRRITPKGVIRSSTWNLLSKYVKSLSVNLQVLSLGRNGSVELAVNRIVLEQVDLRH
jgi:hypothetical protein